MNGVVKIVYLSLLAQGAQNFFMQAGQKSVTFARRESITVVLHGPLEVLGPMAPSFGFGMAALCYLFFLYFNFSGYTDMMIGLGRLLGFRLPENFDRPFTASSFLDFWKRWHASLSLWFRDYCFTPILKRMVKAGVKDPAIATLPAYFISFGLLGLWHGRTWPFILCGLMFATGSSANHFYRSVLNRRVARDALGKLDGSSLYQAFAAAVTFFYISLAITGLWLSEDKFYKSWHSFSLGEATISFSLIVVILSCLLYLVRTLWHKERVQALMVRPVHDFFLGETSFLIAAKIFLVVVWYFVFSANLPDFVYEQF
jgi:D-alanyl-lipoteichoic acid acyltransferase DltB (MBOAT superfamily)